VIPVEVTQTPWRFTTFLDLFDHWQTVIAGVLALVAAFGTVLGTMIIANRQILASREEADRVIAATREQTETTVRLERERLSSESDTLRKSIAVELRLHISRAMGAYDGLYGMGIMPNAPITARMVESRSQMAAPIIYPANAGKIGLLGADAMDVVVVYDLLEIARDSVARQMNSRTPDDISAVVVMGMAQAFMTACTHARGVLPRLRTGGPSHDAKDEALIQRINDALGIQRATFATREA
jgi:hypothetical protein